MENYSNFLFLLNITAAPKEHNTIPSNIKSLEFLPPVCGKLSLEEPTWLSTPELLFDGESTLFWFPFVSWFPGLVPPVPWLPDWVPSVLGFPGSSSSGPWFPDDPPEFPLEF